MINRRDVIRSGATALATLSARPASAQAYPSRPVVIVVPYAAGGATDVVARLIAQHLQPRLGGSVIVENKPGATTAIGTQHVARAAPDGHTLLLTAPPFVIGHYASPKPPYQPTDFAPVVLTTVSPLVVAVSAKVPVTTFPDFVAYARSRPGQLNYGSTGLMGLPHLAAELLCKQAGIQMVHVPYRGGGQVTTDLLSGHIDIYLGNPVEVAPQLSFGVKALAVTSRERSPLMPELPSVHESGFQNFDLSTWTGLIAPKDTDPAIVGRLNTLVSAILADRGVVQSLQDQFSTPKGGSIVQFQDFLAQQHRILASVISQL